MEKKGWLSRKMKTKTILELSDYEDINARIKTNSFFRRMFL